MTDQKPPESATFKTNKVQEVLGTLAKSATDPVHKRLIEAYQGDDPYNALIAQFIEILNEVVHCEA